MTLGIFALTQYQGAIIGPFAKLLGYVINALYVAFSAIGIQNVALCIVVFTIIMRALMIPMNWKQQKSTKLMSRMNPELQAINEKYKNRKDQESQLKMQREIQAVYDKYGSNPLSGCLPLLITFPIMIGLYRVIQFFPAYIPSIKAIYEEAAVALQSQSGYVEFLQQFASAVTRVVTTEDGGMTTNAIIDVLDTFNADKWNQLVAAYPAISGTLESVASRTGSINSVLGLFQITDIPTFTSISVLIPILAGALQWYNGHQMSKANNNGAENAGNNQASQMTKSMNTVMPLMTVFFCFSFNIGIGLYWIMGSVCSIVQQWVFDAKLKTLDIDEMIRKNQEKVARKKAKRGEPQTAQMRDLAQTKTKQIDKNKFDNTYVSKNPAVGAYSRDTLKKNEEFKDAYAKKIGQSNGTKTLGEAMDEAQAREDALAEKKKLAEENREEVKERVGAAAKKGYKASDYTRTNSNYKQSEIAAIANMLKKDRENE